MKLEFFPEAEFEFTEAATFYEGRLRGLGLEFATEVSRVARLLLDRLALGEQLDSTHRRIPLRRFPFALIYRVDGQFVRMVAVAHRRRRPSYWHSRVQDR
jgi:toxin ParE1/3/4